MGFVVLDAPGNPRVGVQAPADEVRGAVAETTFPYQPGYLTFREAPALLEAFARVESEPDAIMFDGQGIAHPRNSACSFVTSA